jgi:bifunctional non-homologous end joining protein LigD
MVLRSSRGRPLNAPAAFIHPCQPTNASKPPSGPGWAHELKHDGYRIQIHVRDGRVRLYTMNGNDWTKRYPRIVKEAARLREPLIIDAEVVHLSADGVADFDALHSRTADKEAVACAFDLLLSGDDLRRQTLIERKKALRWVLRRSGGGIQYVEHTEGSGTEMFEAICKLGDGATRRFVDAGSVKMTAPQAIEALLFILAAGLISSFAVTLFYLMGGGFDRVDPKLMVQR